MDLKSIDESRVGSNPALGTIRDGHGDVHGEGHGDGIEM